MTKHKTLLGWLAALFVAVGSSDLPAQTDTGAPANGVATSSAATIPGRFRGPAPTGPEEIVRLSAFEVRTTQGAGYSAGNAASALKTSQSLMELPADIIVITHDMINDINSHASSDVFQYAGVTTGNIGASVYARGSRIGNGYIDDVPQSTGFTASDNTNIDAYEMIKGPVQIFYPQASLGGTLLETTKKPLPGTFQAILDESVQQWGQQCFTFDINQPIGQLGEGQLTARVEGVVQNGPEYFTNSHDDIYSIFPNLEYDWKNSIIRAQYDAQLIQQGVLIGGVGLLTPTGGLYNGLGPRVSYNLRNDWDEEEQHDARLSWTQLVSENWQFKSQVVWTDARRYNPEAFPSTINWNTNQTTYLVRLDNGYDSMIAFQSDGSGKYNIGPISLISNFGFNSTDTTALSKFWNGTAITIPIGSEAAIDSAVLPSVSASAYPEPANPGSRTETYVTNGYYMQTIDVIPNWLSLVGGFTFSKIETVTDTNLALKAPYISTDLNGHDLLHRMAAVVHVTKELMIYGMESTTFSPSTGTNYFNQPLPAVDGKGDEVGIKSSFLNGKISVTLADYRMALTNQSIQAAFPALNIAGFNYFLPIGSTTSKGYDGSLTLQPLPGLQVLIAFYNGTVRDQGNNPIAGDYDNQWSFFGRYDFDPSSALRGFAFGGGAYRIGGRYVNIASMTLPGNVAPAKNSSGVPLIKLQEGTMSTLFISYRLNKHWAFRVNCQNVLNQMGWPEAGNSIGLINKPVPLSFAFDASYRF